MVENKPSELLITHNIKEHADKKKWSSLDDLF